MFKAAIFYKIQRDNAACILAMLFSGISIWISAFRFPIDKQRSVGNPTNYKEASRLFVVLPY